jgi:hypothetical protein
VPARVKAFVLDLLFLIRSRNSTLVCPDILGALFSALAFSPAGRLWAGCACAPYRNLVAEDQPFIREIAILESKEATALQTNRTD